MLKFVPRPVLEILSRPEKIANYLIRAEHWEVLNHWHEDENNFGYLFYVKDKNLVLFRGHLLLRDSLLYEGNIRTIEGLDSEAPIYYPNQWKSFLYPLKKEDNLVLNISANGNTNYFHFLFSPGLIALSLFENSSIDTQPILYLGPRWKAFGYAEEICRFLGSKNFSYENLVASSAVSYVEKNLSYHILPYHVDWLRRRIGEKVMLHHAEEHGCHSRVLITREKAGSRRLLFTSREIETLVKSDFEVFNLEDMSFIDQVALFINAEEIIAVHGAGLSNVVFCSKNALVIELFPENLKSDYFSNIARIVGLRYKRVSCPVISVTNDIEMSFKVLKEVNAFRESC